MMWIEDLQEEQLRRQALDDRLSVAIRRAGSTVEPGAGEAVARADALLLQLYGQMNRLLLGDRGSVWSGPATWGVHLWELWWEPTRERGRYIVVSLMRDSRGTAYLKVQGRRLPVDDPRLERRLQRALRAAFLEPRVYSPQTAIPGAARDRLPAPSGNGRSGPLAGSLPAAMPAGGTGQPGDQGDDKWGRGQRGQRRRRRGEPSDT
jgi:hypothetical protein